MAKASYPVRIEIIEKVVEITGLLLSTVYKILREKKAKGRVDSPTARLQNNTIIDVLDDSDLERKVK